MTRRLYERKEREVLLFVADGVTGLEKRIKEYFPKADFQSCVVHKVRNTLNKVKARGKTYHASTKEEALKGSEKFKEKWESLFNCSNLLKVYVNSATQNVDVFIPKRKVKVFNMIISKFHI